MATFNAQALLEREGLARETVDYRNGQTIFSQGDVCKHVMYICKGAIKLSVRSERGREATVAILGPGAFFGEACLAGQRNRVGSATAIARSTILRVDKREMVRVLRRQGAMADQFIAHMLVRHVRIERDLIDSLFNSCEKRLARTLLRLARYGQRGQLRRTLPQLSLDTLADMADTTRGSVNRFLKKFKKLGFIEGDGAFTVNSTLLRVVLRE